MDKKILDFYTIEKNEFNYFSQKIVNKKYILYTKPNILPPTYKSIFNNNIIKDKWYKIWFKKNEIPDEIKHKFADNILLQEEIIRVIQKRIEQFNYTCWIIKLQTWKGKSIVCMDIIEYLQLTTLILVSNTKLLQEMIDKFDEMTNCKPEQYWWGKKNIWHITIITKSSFLNIENKYLEDFDLILIDELQTGFSDLFINKFNKWFQNRDIYVYWLSATPYTANLTTADLERYYWKLIEPKQKYDFIPNFHFINYYHLEDYNFEAYHELKQAMIDNLDRRDKQEEFMIKNLSKKCSLILCDRLEEIKKWEEILDRYKDYYYVITITWETKIQNDSENLSKSLNQDKPIIIIGSIQKTATWFDFPIIDTIFLFASIKFESTVIQSVWRALRKAKDKIWADVYIWNDMVLIKQKKQKEQAILDEYKVWVKDIKITEINKKKKDKWVIEFTF